MKRRMTPEEARAWKARWELVNEAEREELRSTPPELKLRQLTTLMGWVNHFGWTEALAAQEDEVRQRWVRLREACGG
jgi:hypothetical protein